MEAVRIGRVISTTSFYFVIPVEREVGSKISCCDFCGGEAVPYKDSGFVEVDDWSYRDGLWALFEKCAPRYDSGSARFSTKEEVDSLLRAVTRATKLSRVDLNTQWLPPLIGAGVGAAMSLVPALLSDQPDQFRVVFLALLGGAFVGGILGIIIGGLYSSRRLARTMIEYCAQKYLIDGDLLTSSATGYPGRIRRAVRTVVG